MRTLLLGLAMLMAQPVWAHGEERLGPHGGFISMPGPFHVELVPMNTHTLNVYLLDLDWRNPTLKDSSVKLTPSAQCTNEKDHFTCVFPKSVDLNKPGTLSVEATREKQKGNSVRYNLPLELTAKH